MILDNSQKIYCAYDEVWPLSRLVPNPRNPNKHPKKQLELLAKIIAGHGWRAPVTVSRRSGYVVRGHGRLAAARLLACDQVPVDLQDYANEAEEYADMVADNQIAELAEIDEEELNSLVAELKGEGYDLALLGFDEKGLEEILAAADKRGVQEDYFDVDAAAEEAKAKCQTKEGDLWQLGSHILLCGDSTDPLCVARLMGNETADMVFTDPPYNVNYESQGRKIKNDKMGSGDFYAFLLKSFKNMYEVTKPGSSAYIWYADSEDVNARCALADAGWVFRQKLVWVKNVFAFGRADYQWIHESCVYCGKPGKSHKFYGGRKQSTALYGNFPVQQATDADGSVILTFSFGAETLVLKAPSVEWLDVSNASTCWRVARPAASKLHPTMKPIELVAKAVTNSCKEGEIVLDLFGGSGSTMIACEETGRQCRMVELDPVYYDVIVRRWEELTKRKAVKK